MYSSLTSTRKLGSITRNLIWQSALLMVLLACGCASTDQRPANIPTNDVPDDLRVNGRIVAAVHATGFQVYTAKADATGKLAWTLKAPDATFDDGMELKGKHYAGPTWESDSDGSKVVAKKLSEHASPTAGAVPWLLLEAVRHEGKGIMSDVTFIQRIHTAGGKAGGIGDAKAGDESRVAYTADYIFYGPGATTRPAMP